MLLYYIDDSFFRPTAFARLMRARLESWMERDRPQLVVVSVSVRCDSALREFAQRWQIPVLTSSGVFDYGGVRGILRCDSLLLEPFPLMRCYSGSFIRAEVRRGRAERVYLDFFPDEQTEAFLRLSEQLEKMLSEQLAEKKWYSPFPQFQTTQRPDRAAMAVLEGRVIVMCDNSPIGLILPTDYNSFIRTSDDYYSRFEIATFGRILRYLALGVSLLLPGIYAAMAMFHQQMLPTKLLLSIIESKQDVPFSTLFEVVGLLCAFELLQQAGLHLPQAVGTAVSIIGGLVVGTAAVDAKLVSPAALIVTASSGICGFTLPNRELSDALRLWRLGLTVLGGVLGLFGVTAGLLLLLIKLAGLESLGRSYLAPFGEAEVKGALVRERLTEQKWRDGTLRPLGERNQR